MRKYREKRLLTQFGPKLEIIVAIFWPILFACTDVVHEKLTNDQTAYLKKYDDVRNVFGNFTNNLKEKLSADRREDYTHKTEWKIVHGEIGLTQESEDLLLMLIFDIDKKRRGPNKKFSISTEIMGKVKSLAEFKEYTENISSKYGPLSVEDAYLYLLSIITMGETHLKCS